MGILSAIVHTRPDQLQSFLTSHCIFDFLRSLSSRSRFQFSNLNQWDHHVSEEP